MADESKTEQATAQRRKKAREQGSIARSRELPALLAAVGAICALMMMGHDIVPRWSGFYRELLDMAGDQNVEPNGPLLFWCAAEVLRWMMPVLMSAALLSIGAGLAQGGFNIAPAALTPKPEKFNPASKIGQIFSLSGLSSLGKSLLPFSAMAWVGISAIWGQWGNILHASSMSLSSLVSLIGGTALGIAWKCALVMLVWAGVDYFLTWRKMESDMKMSKEEVKEEHKQSEGNPHTKMAIRRLRRKMRRRFSKKAVKSATVVVTNPTHYAVCLRYEPEMPAPIVVEKGVDNIALEIRAIAAEEGIPITENVPLAQALYKSVEVDQAIPAALYQAVADILVVIFRAQAELRAEEAQRRNRTASGKVMKR